jgi:acetyl-CoA carboxylase carboxyltransferase component
VLEVDDVIDPADTRHCLTCGLRLVAARPAVEGKRRPFVDIW